MSPCSLAQSHLEARLTSTVQGSITTLFSRKHPCPGSGHTQEVVTVRLVGETAASYERSAPPGPSTVLRASWRSLEQFTAPALGHGELMAIWRPEREHMTGTEGAAQLLKHTCPASALAWGLGLGAGSSASVPFCSQPPHASALSSKQRKGQTLAGGGERPGKLAECLLWTHPCIPSPLGPGPTDMALPVWTGSEVSSP